MKLQEKKNRFSTAIILNSSILLILFFSNVFSAPLRNFPQILIQPNGDTLYCFASGDEYHNWLHDAEGYTIIQHPETGFYTYAIKVNGVLSASSYIVGEVDPQKLGLEKRLNISPNVIKQKRETFLKTSPPMGLAPSVGTINNIVVFIRFSGESEFTDQRSTYDNMFNSSVSGNNSMYNYYREATYNNLTIISTSYPTTGGSTVVSYQDAQSRNYYRPYNAVTNPSGYQGGDNGIQRRDREHTLLRNAINAINSQVSSSLNLDGDNDDLVDNVCFVVYGSPTGWASLLWPHRWSLYSQIAYINGKRVWDYNFQLQNSLLPDNVGVLCHEMFHTLGAPDLYRYTDTYSFQPVYQWDIMAWDLNPPQHMGAYMKYRYGTWISSIPIITTSGTYSLNPLTTSSNNCYRINSPNSTTEYFVVEYRRRTGTFESSVPDEGLLVYRINSSLDGQGNADGPPDEVYIYRPNGTTTSDGNPINANFSSNVSRTSINDGTNPSSFLSNGNAGGLNIFNIGSAGSTISFSVTIPGSPTIILTSPNGGENWQVGANQNVTWTSTSITNVKIEYTTNNGSNWTTIIASTPSGAGSYTWTVPNTPSSQCRVRISDASNSSVNDLSDGIFTISSAITVVNVITPNGGENWQAGSTQNITWTSIGVSNIRIEYTTNNGTNWTIIIASTPAGVGSYAWTVPNTPSTQCRARISDASNASVNDLSDGTFTISPAPSVTVISPNGGENWQVGANQNVTWTSTSITNVKIEYTTNNGTNWTTIIASTPAGVGSYAWTVPNTPSSQCKVRISDASNASVNDLSNGTFTISLAPTVTVISPNGGESWQVGTNQNITWTSSSVTNIKIEYTTNNGSSWLTIVTSTPASSGIYSWTIPNTPSNQCRVKVSDLSNPSLNDQSDNVFTILPLLPNAPVLISPLNNVINQPTTLTLIWNRVTNADSYKLQLLDSTSMNILIIDSTITDSSKQLTSLTNRTKYYWRVMAKNISGWSPFSETWNFRVMNLKGDLDGNNLIQALDASYILQNVVGLRELDSMQSFAADVNNDNIVGAYDAAWILYFVVYGIWPNW